MTLQVVKDRNPELSTYLRDEGQFVLGVQGWSEPQIYFALGKSAHHRRDFEDTRFRETSDLYLQLLARTIWQELISSAGSVVPDIGISLDLRKLLDQADRNMEIGARVQKNISNPP